MEYVLLSCGEIQKKLINKGLEPKYIVSFDSNEYNVNDIISIYKFKNNYNNETILIPSFITDETNIDEIYNQLIELGFKKEKILFIPIEIILGEHPIDFSSFYHYEEVTYLDYLEINIIDCCNMNCTGGCSSCCWRCCPFPRKSPLRTL